MQTPKELSPRDWNKSLREFYSKEVERMGVGFQHKSCHAPIAFVNAYVSIHFIGFKCAGNGRVTRIEVPYCPRCEQMPELYGCFHVAYDSEPLARTV